MAGCAGMAVTVLRGTVDEVEGSIDVCIECFIFKLVEGSLNSLVEGSLNSLVEGSLNSLEEGSLDTLVFAAVEISAVLSTDASAVTVSHVTAPKIMLTALLPIAFEEGVFKPTGDFVFNAVP